jgi:hypothetical protein
VNKAFVREPDDTRNFCPSPDGCGAAGVPVPPETLMARLGPERAATITDGYCCLEPTCDVVYFDPWGAVIARKDVLGPLPWPKDSAGPLCPCTGLLPSDIQQDAEIGRTERIRDLIARAESTDARCRTTSLDGRSCVTLARRLFLRHRPQDA